MLDKTIPPQFGRQLEKVCTLQGSSSWILLAAINLEVITSFYEIRPSFIIHLVCGGSSVKKLPLEVDEVRSKGARLYLHCFSSFSRPRLYLFLLFFPGK